ncbi:MAG: lactate utilization protein [Sphingomonadaceae bacterium]
MHPSKQWLQETRARAAVEALRRNGFDSLYAEDSASARRTILDMIPAGAAVGFGGSLTLDETGLMEALRDGPYRLINPPWVERAVAWEERRPLRREALLADFFLTGTNAVTMDGRLVILDSNGNRAAATLFGPGRTIVVAGANKVVPTLEEALDRAANLAAPANARRLNCDTPCTTTGVCSDCDCRDRICKATVILHRRTRGLDVTVVLVGEDLGL